MPVKAIIWDMGGVILYMQNETPRKELASEFGLSLQRVYAEIFDSETAQKAMIGQIPVSDHWQNVGASLGIPADRLVDFLGKFWSSDAIDYQLIGLIQKLKQSYKTGVLSNAWEDLGEIMLNRWKIARNFDDIVISAEVGLAKPDPQIYRLAADRLRVQPHEVIFIDDLARNIQAAKAVGFQTIQFITRSQVLCDLSQLLQAGGEQISPSLDKAIAVLGREPNDRPINPYDLVQLQVELEYQRHAKDWIIPFPGSTEHAGLLIYQSDNEAWSFSQPDFSRPIFEGIQRFGLGRAFHEPQQLQEILSNYGAYKLGEPFHSYYFSHLPSSAEFPDVRENTNRYEVLIDQVPVSWAWSIRENGYCAEVAVETLPEFRQRGYARQVTAAWGRAIRQQGRVAFYSHAANNHPSKALAHSLGLIQFAKSIAIE